VSACGPVPAYVGDGCQLSRPWGADLVLPADRGYAQEGELESWETVAGRGSRGWLWDSSLASSLFHPSSHQVKSNLEANCQVAEGSLALDEVFADL